MWKNKNNGFTITELIIYVGAFIILSLLVVNTILIMSRSFTTFRVSRDINNSATVALERIVRELRLANNVDDAGSIFGSNPGYLSLDTVNSGNNPTNRDFYVSGGKIVLKEGAGGEIVLTGEDVVIDNLIFRKIDTGISDAVKVELTLSETKGSIVKQEKYYSTAVLRRSY